MRLTLSLATCLAVTAIGCGGGDDASAPRVDRRRAYAVPRAGPVYRFAAR